MRMVCMAVILGVSLGANEVKDFKMTSMTFTIPTDENTLVMQRNCQWCHSYGYIINQGKQSKKFWEKIVHKMKNNYKAPINARDEKLAVSYLFKHFGNGKEE